MNTNVKSIIVVAVSLMTLSCSTGSGSQSSAEGLQISSVDNVSMLGGNITSTSILIKNIGNHKLENIGYVVDNKKISIDAINCRTLESGKDCVVGLILPKIEKGEKGKFGVKINYADREVTKNISYNYTDSISSSTPSFIAVGAATVLISSDGTSWTRSTVGLSGVTLLGATVTESGGFMAVGYDTDMISNQLHAVIVSSSDGINWSRVYSVGNNSRLNGVTVTESGGFIAVGYDSSSFPISLILRSNDGVKWTRDAVTPSISFNAVAANTANQVVAVGNGPSILTSNNGGLSWANSYISNSLLTTFNSIVAKGPNFIAVGDNGLISQSSNGTNWANQASNTSATLRGVAVNNTNGYVAVGDRGTVITSIDGTNWRKQASPTNQSLYGVANSYDANLVVAVGWAGAIIKSINGIDWVSVYTGVSVPLFGVAGK